MLLSCAISHVYLEELEDEDDVHYDDYIILFHATRVEENLYSGGYI